MSRRLFSLALATVLVVPVSLTSASAVHRPPVTFFDRVATIDAVGPVAEIAAASPDGDLLIYTDSEGEQLGFADISNLRAPQQTALAVGGEPTSVAISPDGRRALAVVNSDTPMMLVIRLSTKSIVAQHQLPGQPDSIKISPDGRFAAVAIENERDEEVAEGVMPQDPPGSLVRIALTGRPKTWSLRTIDLTGLAERFPTDPEPEFVDINRNNLAAVTLQENNHVAIVNLQKSKVVGDWSAGTTTHPADLQEDGEISFDDVLTDARREPDAITWAGRGRLATANEGDYDLDLGEGEFTGGRNFTIFARNGTVLYEPPGASLEIAAARQGYYPDDRSENKGIEIEGIEVGRFHDRPFIFVGAERGNFVAVYRLFKRRDPALVQLLPTGSEPEGLLAIPSRNLFVTSNEGDGTLSVFKAQRTGEPSHPDVVSASVAWGALSGLSVAGEETLYAVPDDVFAPSRIFTIDHSDDPAMITEEVVLNGSYDLEGVASISTGGWWVVSEGTGDADGDPALESRNLLMRVAPDGAIVETVELPADLQAQQVRFGYEGVALSPSEDQIFVAFQREWADDPSGLVKIGRYTPATGEWAFLHYPLDEAPSADAWVGLSDIAFLDEDTLLVLERDNQQRDDAAVKRVYSFSISNLAMKPYGQQLAVVDKTLVRDLLVSDDWRLEKAEGIAVAGERLIIVSDNDGAGETRLLKVPLM